MIHSLYKTSHTLSLVNKDNTLKNFFHLDKKCFEVIIIDETEPDENSFDPKKINVVC